ncbi:hypothetical protein GCM10022239_05210 [Leifsonia bigeumensis]|uniref:Flp pilus-assembly TadG-like N-terminal domain-containing protein n=1 Tax=Leifsonella bigeumensis TaxID=433643 RepID=A0ABP7F711_9MICO
MFLKRLVPVRGEDGAALAAVLGAFAIGLLLTTLIMSSVVQGLGWSTFSRASIQSHAAADAGIVAARTGLYSAGNCNSQPTAGVYASTGSPAYSAKVERNDGAGWVVGCPTVKTSQVRITSIGTAEAPAVAGVSAGDTSTVEAVYQYLHPGVNPSGSAVYIHGDFQVDANSTFDISEAGSNGLLVKDGNFTCDKNNSVINGSILVLGDLVFGGKCNVTGSAVVTGSAKLNTGRIDGDLTAGSVDPNPPGTQVGGTYTQSSVVPPSPDWVNLTYKPGDWLTSDGLPFEVQTVTSPGTCKLSSGNMGGTSPGYPLILNALGCVGGISLNQNTNIKLTSDLVIFANKFDFPSTNSLAFSSSSSAGHRLWFITPDNGPVGDKAPTCDYSYQGDFSIKNTLTISPPIAALLYTPCAFDGKNGFTWQGQIIAGGDSYAENNPSFTYVPIGAAGVDFNEATVTPIITKPQPGALITMRDRSVG